VKFTVTREIQLTEPGQQPVWVITVGGHEIGAAPDTDAAPASSLVSTYTDWACL
jgi:hypothetical protein